MTAHGDDGGRSLDPRSKIAAAQARIAALYPYLAGRVYRFRPVPVPGLGTLGTDRGARLAFDPAAVAPLSVAELATIITHETGHHALTTWERRGNRPMARWNTATDAEINAGFIARSRDLPWPAGWIPVLPGDFGELAGQTAEEYDAALARREQRKAEEDRRDQERGAAQGEHGGPQEAERPDDADDEDGDADEDGESEDGDGDIDRAGGDGDLDVAGTSPTDGGQDGERPARRGLPGSADAPDADDIEAALPDDAPPPVSAEESAVDDYSTASKIQEYEAAHGRGSVPGALSTWAADTLRPRVNPWQRVLAGRIRSEVSRASGCDDYSQRIARRYWATRAVIGPGAPIIRGTDAHAPKVGIVADTSASMRGCYGTIQAEALQIARAAASGRAELIAVDCEIQGRTRISGAGSAERLRTAMQGGGGTDMRIGIAEAARLRCDVAIVLTDGRTPWPTALELNRLRVRVVVAIVGDGKDPPPHLGRPVRIPSQAER